MPARPVARPLDGRAMGARGKPPNLTGAEILISSSRFDRECDRTGALSFCKQHGKGFAVRLTTFDLPCSRDKVDHRPPEGLGLDAVAWRQQLKMLVDSWI